MQVVLVANSLPALNDVTAMELPDIVAEAAKVCLFFRTLIGLYFFSCLGSLFKNSIECLYHVQLPLFVIPSPSLPLCF